MAYVDKVMIKGIRSFDPENKASIELYKPLTLIVGSNGAGKTTIIECLRVACTGTLPPNARLGQSFVRDPKIANESEVKAQIMVRFCNTAGDPFVVIRSYQLCQKANSMQFKAIDQTLKRVDPRTNENLVITHTCADMDKIVPTMMGVSRVMLMAVIDNVIFVHQDESNWPLAEPKVLKEKFDLLFGTSKYTKWFEEIRKLKTEKTNELKVKKVDLGHLQTHKTKALRLKKQLEDKEAEIVCLNERIDDLELEITNKAADLEQLKAEVQLITEREAALASLRSQLETLEKINAALYAKLPDGDFEDEDPVLREGIDTCEETVEKLKRDVDRLDDEVSEARGASRELKDQYSRACQKQGKLQAEVTAHERNCQDRDRQIELLRTELALASEEDEDVEIFLAAFEKIVVDTEDKFEELRSHNREQDEKRNEHLRQLTTQIDALAERTRIQRQEKSQNEMKREQLKKKAVEILIDETDLEELEAKEAEALRKLQLNRERTESEKFSEKIAEAVSKVEEIQQAVHKLKEERRHVSQASEADTELKLKMQESKSKQEQITKLLADSRNSMMDILSREVEAGELKGSYALAWEGLQSELATKEEELKEANSALSVTKHRLDSGESDLKQKEAALASCRARLSNGLRAVRGSETPVDSYDSTVQELEQKLHEMRDKSSLGGATIKLMKSFIKQAAAHDMCPICERDFTPDEKTEFLEQKEEELKNLPTRMKEEEELNKTLSCQLSQLKELQPVWIEYCQLKHTAIPELGAAQAKLRAELELCHTKAEKAEQAHTAQQQRVDAAKQFSENVIWPVTSLLSDLSTVEASLTKLKQQMSQSSDTRSLTEIEADLESMETEKGKHEVIKDQLQRQQQQLSADFMKLSQEHLELKNQIERYRTNIANKQIFEQQVAEIEQKNASIVDQLAELQLETARLQPEKEKLQTERKETRLKTTQEERLLDQQGKDKRRRLDTFKRMLQVVSEFETGSTARDLESIQIQLRDLDEEQQLLQHRIEQKEKMRREHIDDIAEHQELTRRIEECLKWREGKKGEEEVRDKTAALEQEIQNMERKQTVTRRVKALEKEVENLKHTQSQSTGSIGTLQDTLADMREELESDLYRDVDSRYKAAMIEKVLLELGIDDLQTFHKACERALLSYHTMKMEEINASIRELWATVYKGSDIEYIQIKAEEVKGHAGRSHSYRLSMFVTGTELEMRGRCSAGQKVLAGIIVRLALAETFCVKCGILALDEPTTNLDAANVESLADALREIIENRQQQENFQLIVITHDDKFARRIRSREHAEYLWRVTKDAQHRSTLTRERI